MKREEFKKVLAMEKPELEALLKESREKFRGLKFDLAAGKVKNVGALRMVRKDIARIMTVLQTKAK